jgi:hypothetical protein
MESWNSYTRVDSFSSLGHAVLDSVANKLTVPLVFAADFAISGLKMVINEVRK